MGLPILNKYAKRYIKNYVEDYMTEVKVEPGNHIHYNYKCHLNAVHYAENGECDPEAILMVMEIEEDCDWPIIHFVNKALGEDKYVDNTYGAWSKTYKYYKVMEIPKEDFHNVVNTFMEYRAHLRYILPWYIKWFSDVRH